MKIAATQYSGKHRALEVYVSGCNGPHCKGCHNQELWDFNVGKEFDSEWEEEFIKKLHDFKAMIDKVWILGGEPLDQDHDQIMRLIDVCWANGFNVWLFTKRELKDIPGKILIRCNYVKCGPYIEELKTDDNKYFGVKLASSNQIIYWIK